ncbi:hypothetical protein NM208_g6647 [Fusarium decemcellulare]|uniref:Uncharacterized protein n=1 Tax=Fusarium decemcellulare TaxID=57161 RepID=A0ACC1SCG2_9HYPO|nr:hypothetical protein NM208_g6647 [Fusarium decemcellulare]
MSLSSSPVTVGVWTDYSRTGILAKVLTLSNRDATVLVAFLATLVSIVGVRSWRITRFILFMAFTSKLAPQVDLGEEMTRSQILAQHVILRNSETANGAVFSLLGCSFSKSPHRVKTFFLSLLALVHGAVFIALSILTSQIVLGRTVVSRPTASCGQWTTSSSYNGTDQYLASMELHLNGTEDADNYVQNCYFETRTSGIFQCERLVSQSIPFSVSHNASCPFKNDICRNASSFAMDTGNISLAHLGINTKLADQLYFRRRSVCSILREEMFYVETLTSKSANFSYLRDGENITVYDFDTGQGGESNPKLVSNYDLGTSYELNAYLVPINDSLKNDTWTSLLSFSDELYRGFHGPSIILLSGQGIKFYQQYDDPLWSVHREIQYPNVTIFGTELSEMPTAYRMDRPLNVIGCDERFQICYKSINKCLPWSGLYPDPVDLAELDETALDDLGTTKDLIIPLSMLIHHIPQTSIPESISDRGSSALRASRSLYFGIQASLEEEQWKTELNYWFGMAMARLQLDVYKTIDKPAGLDLNRTENYWDMNNGTYKDELCGRIRFNSSDHTSLSFLGVMVIVVVSAFLILLSFFEDAMGLVPSRWCGSGLLRWEASENIALLKAKEILEKKSTGDGGDQLPGAGSGGSQQDNGKNGIVDQGRLQEQPRTAVS